MKYHEWIDSVPEIITDDQIWNMQVYRLALFIGDIGWRDVTKLYADRRTIALANQLYRALGSIGANIAEGYSRNSDKEKARFYEYALGSARESRDWYYRARYILGEQVADHRMQILTQIIRLLLTMIPRQRAKALHEARPTYDISSSWLTDEIPFT